MIYVKATAVCETAPETKVKCRARRNFMIALFEIDHHEEMLELPKGWGRYLNIVLCPKCVKRTVKMYGQVTS